MVDIFDLKERYPLPDDNHTETFVDVEGNTVALTPDRVIRMVSNVLGGHHPQCNDADCTSMPVAKGEPLVGMCMILGLKSPEVAPFPEPHRSVGFDIDRDRS